MGKRKLADPEKSGKKPKLQSESDETSDSSTLTKQTRSRSKIVEAPAWSDSDMLELIGKIEESIPEDDALSYHSRLEKIDWGKVALKHRSAKECQKAWSGLLKQVRKFRLLKEIVADMKRHVQAPKKAASRDSVARHPDKPKQPRNSYMFFVEEKRKEVMKQHPHMLPQDVAKKLGQIFKNLEPAEREKYDLLANLAKQEHAEQLQRFYGEHPDLAPRKRRRSAVDEEDGPPEKPKTPFQLFMGVESAKEGVDGQKMAFIQRCRQRWNEIRDKDKLFWINWAEEQYDKYVSDLKDYIKGHPGYEPPNVADVLTKIEKRIKARCLGKPDKPPHGPYQLFTKMMMDNDEVKRINPKEALVYISEKWKSCSEEEKNEYKTRSEQMWEEYRSKLSRYLVTVPSEERKRIKEEEKSRNEEEKEDRIGKPDPPPLTEYKYFLSVYNGEENPVQVWENMSDEERKVYEEKLKAKKRNYVMMYEQYLKSLSKEEIQKIAESLTDKYDTSSESLSDRNDTSSEFEEEETAEDA